ncbi:uncharacterized protein LOC121421557 [Lytechinus variegatus]|uniref:uncharacterized protein LOC121421557 n=1 Tax=Lytechinus variegatus TaxID=7654 RepID=UPI001BB2B266|nr:uncharacterized protein LOC121421557 [Lytechinus variegatus]
MARFSSTVPVLFFAFSACILFTLSDAMSVNLAEAVDAEMKAHLIRMEVLADKLHFKHRRVVREMKENHARMRRRRGASLDDLRHGFVPGSGVGNRESLEIKGMVPLPNYQPAFSSNEKPQWNHIAINKKIFMVTSSYDPGFLTITEFNATRENLLSETATYPIPVRAMKPFTQSYYDNGVTTKENKIVVSSDDETFVIVLNEDGTENQINNVTVIPLDVTDVDFFSIGVDSYLVFTRDTDDPNGDKSVIYLWSSTNKVFAVRQEIRTYGAQEVHAFEMTGHHYLLIIEKNKESSIWRYNTRQSQFTLFHRLEGGAAKSGLYFTEAHESFIVIITAAGDRSILYQWDAFDFHESQFISTPMALSWSTMRDPATCQDAPVLALSSMREGENSLRLFTVVDSKLVGGPFPVSPLPVDLPAPEGAIDLHQFNDWKENVYTVVSYVFDNLGVPFFFELDTGINPVPSPYGQAVQAALGSAATAIRNQLDEYREKVIDGEQALRDKISLKDGELVIGGNVTFNGTIIFNGTVVVDTIDADDIIVDNTVDGVDLTTVLDALEAKVDANTAAVQALRAKFDDRVTKNGVQTVTAHKIFKSLSVDGELEANTITAPTINGVDIEALEISVVRNNENGQTIDGELSFDNSVSVAGDLDLQNGVLVNGFDMANAVTETGAQTISGAKIFSNAVSITGDAVVQESVTLDTVDVSQDVVTLAGTHTLSESITFNDVLTVNSNIVTSSTVDGVDVSDMNADTVRESGGVTIEGDVTFQNSVTVDDDVTIGGDANDIDLSDFDDRAVRKNVDIEITGRKTFEKAITINGNLELQAKIDGVDLFTDALLVNATNSSTIKDSLIEDLLFPYGSNVGDLSIPIEDDNAFVLVTMDQPLPFFGTTINEIYLNVNGLLSTTEPVSNFIPLPFPLLGVGYIAPFWADVDITEGGNIYYRQIMNPAEDDIVSLEINRIICQVFRVHFKANWIFVVTWDAVAYYESTSSITNTFQNVIASDGTHAYVIFNYDDINWTTGSISGGAPETGLGGIAPAVVGVNAGDGEVYHTVPSSFTPDVVNIEETSNIGVPGRYVFDIGNVGNIQNFMGQEVTGEKTFTDVLKVVGSVSVNGLTDGVDFDDLITLSGTCTIDADKIFADGIMVQGDLHTSGTVDGVDVSLLASQVMKRSGTQEVQGTVTFEDNVVVSKSVVVDGTVNTVDVSAMEADAVYANKALEQVITADKTFTLPFSIGSGGNVKFTGTVNTYEVENDFMDLTSGESVTGTKTFTDGFSASSDMSVTGNVDGVSMSTLWAQAALVTESETLAGTKTFAGTMSVTGDLTVGGDVNTVDLSTEVMMVNADQEVTGAMTFECFKATGNVQAADGDITNLNGEDWTAFVDGRVTLSTNQDISGDVTFADQVTVNGNIDTDSLVNDIDLPDLKDSILYKTGDQTITGAKTFTGSVEFDGAVSITGTLDGVNIEDMTGRAIYLDDGTQSISSTKTFTDALIVSNHITVSGDVNGVDLAALNSDIVWTDDGAQSIAGKKIFNDGFHASQSITVSGTVNDVDISEDVLTLTRTQTITGSYTFDSDVAIAESLTVSGTINDVDIQALDADAMKKNEVQDVSSHIVFENDVSVTGDITVNPTETVDTVDLSELKSIAKLVDEPFTLPNAVTFEKPVTFDDVLDITGTVHDKNVQTWAPTVLRLDGTQTITGNHMIEGSLSANEISVPSTLQTITAYGINVNTFVADAVKLQGDRTITGSKTFMNDVTVEKSITVSGTVDGIDISDEIVTLDGAQTISGAKTFDTCDVQTAGNILISGSVNDIEISQEEADTLDFRSAKKMEGHKTFTKDATVSGNIQFNGYVDGKDITEGFTLNTEQTSTAYYVFNQKANVDGDVSVSGLVKTVNLGNINTKRITLAGLNTVDATLTFNDMVILEDNVTTAYLFDGVDLSELNILEDTRFNEFEDDLYMLACFAETQCERTESIAGVVNNFIDAIDYVESVQIIGQHIRQFEPFSIDGETFMAAAIYSDEHGDVCTDSIVYKFNTTTGNFQEFQRLPTNGAVSWEHFFIDDELCLVVANAGHTACPDSEPVISGNSIFRYRNESFTLVGSAGEEMDATSDVAAFIIDGAIFMVLTTYEGNLANVYKYHEGSESFQVFQDITTGVTSSVESVMFDEMVFLVFTLYYEEESAVYRYNSTAEKFELFQMVESEHARVVTSFNYMNSQGFALADHISVSDVDATFEVQVRVFTWNDEDGRFDMMWTLPVVAPGDVDVFIEGNFLYMCVVQEYHSIDLFRYEGSAGFVKFYEIPHHGVRSVEIISLQDEEYRASDDIEYEQLFIAVAVDPFPKHDIYSRLLKIVNIGGSVHVETWEDMCDSGLKDSTRINTPEPTC